MKYLSEAIRILGVLSFLSLVGFYLALHDIWHEYASPEVWTRAGHPLPEGMSPVPGCAPEWMIMQVGFVLIATFHILLFVRFLKRLSTPTSDFGQTANS